MAAREPGDPVGDCESALAYLRQLAHERRASPHTLAAYHRDLGALLRLADGRPPESLTPHDIRRFVARLHGEGLGGRSIARQLSAWRGYYRWLVLHREHGANPVDGIRAPKSPARLPRVLSPDQAVALLDHPPSDPLEIRDRAMFELFYSSGLRLSELAGLAVDLWGDEVTVTGKRGKTRIVPVGRAAQAAVAEWRSVRGALAAPGENALFVSRLGRRLSSRAIEERLRRWAAVVGLGVGVHPHMLRHSFASHLLQSSGDLRAVQDLLGHASIRSTQVYTHLDFQHLAKVYDNAHPRARKR
ncbi:MAG: tyrosine recombinase XerC [Rhodocyclaceae bacterium]|nr:tyrosine recombinase XerC [Rhodocyclaceae bacterium]